LSDDNGETNDVVTWGSFSLMTQDWLHPQIVLPFLFRNKTQMFAASVVSANPYPAN
jgi:hypothetical protein